MVTRKYKGNKMINKEMLVSDIMYNDTNIEQCVANQMATAIEQDLKSLNGYSLYDVGNTIACDLTEEDLSFLDVMGI